MNFMKSILNHIELSTSVVMSTLSKVIGVNRNTVLEYFTFSI